MIIGDGIMLGAGGESASIFVTGLSETDTVTASKDGKTVIGKWTKIPNPAYVVPDGYTQLEYIESSGTQYIDTGFGKNTGVFVVHSKFSFQNVSPDNYSAYYLCGSNVKTGSVKTQNLAVGIINNGGDIKLRAAAGNMVIDNGPKFFNSAPVANMVYEITHMQDNANKTLKAVCGDYEESYNFTGTPTNNSMWLFALNGNTSRSNMRLYSYTLLVDGTTVRDFVPSKRISDGVIGLYDKENDVFYTNAGTGTFTAGAEIPQTFDGFLIDKIKDYGTYIITANNGVTSRTQEVLIDSASMFCVEIWYDYFEFDFTKMTNLDELYNYFDVSTVGSLSLTSDGLLATISSSAGNYASINLWPKTNLGSFSAVYGICKPISYSSECVTLYAGDGSYSAAIRPMGSAFYYYTNSSKIQQISSFGTFAVGNTYSMGAKITEDHKQVLTKDGLSYTVSLPNTGGWPNLTGTIILAQCGTNNTTQVLWKKVIFSQRDYEVTL